MVRLGGGPARGQSVEKGEFIKTTTRGIDVAVPQYVGRRAELAQVIVYFTELFSFTPAAPLDRIRAYS